MDLVKELGIENFSEDQKNELLMQFTDSLLKRLIVRVYEKLNKDDQDEFDKLSKEGSVEKINKFLSEKVPDLRELREEEMNSLLEEMKNFVKSTK